MNNFIDDECWETTCMHNNHCDTLVTLDEDECPICLCDNPEGCPYKTVKIF